MLSPPTVLEGMQWLPHWDGECAHVSPCWTASSRDASAVDSSPYPTVLTALVVFCKKISSHLQLPVHVDTAERNEWCSSDSLMPHCFFQVTTACIKGWNAMWTHSSFTELRLLSAWILLRHGGCTTSMPQPRPGLGFVNCNSNSYVSTQVMLPSQQWVICTDS